MAKYFEKPFAISGDKSPVTDDSISSIVSYETGYTPAYELDPNTDPDGLFIDRQRFNQIMFDVTSNIKEWQEQTFPAFIADDGSGNPFSYPIGAILNLAGVNYQAVVNGTTTTPPSAEFIVFNGSFYDNSTSGISAETVQGAIDELSTSVTAQDQSSWNDGISTTESVISPLKLDTKIKTLAIGEGQTWQILTASRAYNTVYTNTTGRAIFVSVTNSAGNSGSANILIDGVITARTQGQTGATNVQGSASVIVPDGSTYEVVTSGSNILVYWLELR